MKNKLTESDVSHKSARNKEYAEANCARAMTYLIDKDQSKRLAINLCSYCYYFCQGRMAGQAFTEWTCQVCEKESMHPNTATPHVCETCAKKHVLCRDCGADVHLRSRRKESL